MSGQQMLKYHLVIPGAIFGLLLVIGVPLGTALFVGMMTGCVGMVFMMAGGGHQSHADHDVEDPATRR